jgi:hypothetical protein
MSEETPEKSNIEDNLQMVTYIMLHRLYDIMILLANMTAKSDDDKEQIAKMIEYHEAGYLLGPNPAYTPNPSEEPE